MDSSGKVLLFTNGCPENRIDMARIEEFLKSNDWVVTNNLPEADTIIFDTCALTQDLEDASIELIKQVASLKKPSAELVVCGCLPRINSARARHMHPGIVLGFDETQRLNELFKRKRTLEQTYANSLIKQTKFLKRSRWVVVNLRKKGLGMAFARLIENCRQRRSLATGVCAPDVFCIKIATGCPHNCSFCSVRLSRGPLRSKPLDEVCKEFDEGLRKGYREFAFIGTNVGVYGCDQEISLSALLRELIKRDGDYKIRLRNIQPRQLINMMPELYSIFKSGKISFLTSAVQSGNNRILQRMNRGYRVEDFEKVMETLKREFPQIHVRTQCMVGFPTETNEEFRDTVRLLDRVRFDFVEIYMFQPRPGTKAADMEGQIPVPVVRKRYATLLTKVFFKECFKRN